MLVTIIYKENEAEVFNCDNYCVTDEDMIVFKIGKQPDKKINYYNVEFFYFDGKDVTEDLEDEIRIEKFWEYTDDNWDE